LFYTFSVCLYMSNQAQLPSVSDFGSLYVVMKFAVITSRESYCTQISLSLQNTCCFVGVRIICCTASVMLSICLSINSGTFKNLETKRLEHSTIKIDTKVASVTCNLRTLEVHKLMMIEVSK